MPPPRRDPRVQERVQVKSLLDDLLIAPPAEETVPILPEVPILTAVPTLQAAVPILAPIAGAPTLSPILQAAPGRASGLDSVVFSERVRRKIINNVVLVSAPPPLPPAPKSLWWMPGFRYRNARRSRNTKPDPLMQKRTVVDFDVALEALADRQKGGMIKEWRADLVPTLWADQIADERKALIGYPEGYGGVKTDDEFYPPELFELVTEAFCETRQLLISNPGLLPVGADHRYNLLEHITEWWGHPLSWPDITESDGSATSALACAADYVAWKESQLVKGVGEALRKLLDRCDRMPEERYPMDNLFFPHHHDGFQIERSQQGNRIAMRGGFAPAEAEDGEPLIVYVSAAGMFQDRMPRMVPGWRQVTMTPLIFQYDPKHVCLVDCRLELCGKYEEPLFDDPDECYGSAC